VSLGSSSGLHLGLGLLIHHGLFGCLGAPLPLAQFVRVSWLHALLQSLRFLFKRLHGLLLQSQRVLHPVE